MKKYFVCAATMVLFGFLPPAFAATSPALFSGAVNSTCVLTVGVAGIITPNADFTKLSSDNAGGSESTVSVLATGAIYKVSAIAPGAFTAGPSTADSFTSKYTLSGATSASNVAGATTTTLTPGVTNVAVDLEADKSSGTFNAGIYNAAVTVRCE